MSSEKGSQEIINSQEMADMEESVHPQNTTNSTHWGVKKFEEWCLKRNVPIDLRTVDVEILADVLRRFYAEAKTNKGLPLSPSSSQKRSFSQVLGESIRGEPSVPTTSTATEEKCINSNTNVLKDIASIVNFGTINFHIHNTNDKQ